MFTESLPSNGSIRHNMYSDILCALHQNSVSVLPELALSVATRDRCHVLYVYTRLQMSAYLQTDESDGLLCVMLTFDCMRGNAFLWRLTKVKVR
jgi:hypothetical protein